MKLFINDVSILYCTESFLFKVSSFHVHYWRPPFEKCKIQRNKRRFSRIHCSVFGFEVISVRFSNDLWNVWLIFSLIFRIEYIPENHSNLKTYGPVQVAINALINKASLKLGCMLFKEYYNKIIPSVRKLMWYWPV